MECIDVGDCESLVEVILPEECGNRAEYLFFIEDKPRILVDAYPQFGVALWAWCCVGNATTIDLMDEELRDFLKDLAKKGIMVEEVHDGVKYQFDPSKFHSYEIRRFSICEVLTLVCFLGRGQFER